MHIKLIQYNNCTESLISLSKVMRVLCCLTQTEVMQNNPALQTDGEPFALLEKVKALQIATYFDKYKQRAAYCR